MKINALNSSRSLALSFWLGMTASALGVGCSEANESESETANTDAYQQQQAVEAAQAQAYQQQQAVEAAQAQAYQQPQASQGAQAWQQAATAAPAAPAPTNSTFHNTYTPAAMYDGGEYHPQLATQQRCKTRFCDSVPSEF